MTVQSIVPPMVMYKPTVKSMPSPGNMNTVGAVNAAVVFTSTVVAAEVLSHNLIVPADEDATTIPRTLPAPVLTNADAVRFLYDAMML
jgi:hypothetical protein